MWPFTTKAAPDRSDTDAPKQPNILYLQSGVGVSIVKWSSTIAVEAAMRHPIVFRALDKIALSVQQMRWYAEIDPYASASDKTNKQTFIKELNSLLESPNGDMTPAMLRYWMALNYASYGRVPLKVGFSAMEAKRPNGIYPLEARHVNVRLDERGIPIQYRYGDEEKGQKYPSRHKAKDGQSFVEQVWKPGIRGYQHKDDQNSPLNAVGLPAEVIKLLLVRAFETASGRPNVRYLVTTSKTLTEPQKEALKKHLNEDHGLEGSESGQIPILQNAADLQIHDLKMDLSDIHSKMPSDDMARLIFGAFGIPIALAGMGAADGAKFAGNYIESRQSFWEDTIIPGYVNPLFQGLTQMLCPPGVRIVGDPDSIPALVEGRVNSMKNASNVGFLTTNEKRDIFGWEETDKLPVQTGTMPTGADTTTEGTSNDEE